VTHEELDAFLESHQEVEWALDQDNNLLLRHTQFDSEHEKLKIEPRALAQLTPQKLESLLVGGHNVEHITRVTGYFSRVSGWNKGKRGELAERDRVTV